MLREENENRPLLSGSDVKFSRKVILMAVGIGLLLIFVTAITTSLIWSATRNKNHDSGVPVTPSTCEPSKFPLDYRSFYSNHGNGDQVAAETVILLQNITLWTGTGETYQHIDLLIKNGKVAQIGQNIPKTNVNVIFIFDGQYVTPGLVDMHSHLGVYSFPEDGRATQDGNELTNPTLPQIRAMDAFNPFDPAIPHVRSGGVTSSLVLPGSGNVMGGESLSIKLRGNTISQMLIPNAPRTLKMACGENPKNVYGNKGVTPDSRMGVGWKFRELFFKAAQLKQQQDLWDCKNSEGSASEPRPEDLSLDSLVGVLRKQVRLNIHCYKVQDIEMVLRTSKEYNFSVAAFHHALEAWKIPNLLIENDVVSAIFADHWGFKFEAYDGSTLAPLKLVTAGAKMALKSDHPVIFAKWLMFEAAKAVYYGVKEQDALAAVTRIPANAIGLGNRIGTLEVGKDADFVVWDRHPFELGALPDKVFIDGAIIDDYGRKSVPFVRLPQATLEAIGDTCTAAGTSKYAVFGVTVYTMNSQNEVLTDATIVVENGIVTCIGNGCNTAGATGTYTLNGGHAIPGIVSSASDIGQEEVNQESGTWDGVASLENGASIRALDGIHFHNVDNKKLKAAKAAGINTVITSPQGSYLISGQGVAFATNGQFIDDAVIHPNTSLHIHIGNNAKRSGLAASFSGQIAALRNYFTNNKDVSPFSDALSGQMPVVAHVNQADEIAAVLRLKRDFGFRLVIIGGAEAYMLASSLAAENVGVILAPPRIPPSTFPAWNAVPNAAALLENAGVAVGLGIQDTGDVRNLIWEAGFAYTQGLSNMTALASITKTPAQLFGIYDRGIGSIAVGQKANFIAYSSDPLSIQSHPILIGVGSVVTCNPKQF